MATVEDWNKYINVVHELALIEDDLRAVAALYRVHPQDVADRLTVGAAERILFERFGVE